MDTRRPRACLLTLVAALLLADVAAPTFGVPPRPQNLLMITLDTMRADRLPSYGFHGYATPAIARLAAEGMVVEEAFAAVPLTLPSHASMFTGMHPPRIGVRDNADAPLSPEFTTLAEALRGRGLETAAFVASAVIAPERGLGQGFDLYVAPDPAGRNRHGRRRAGDVVDGALTWFERRGSEPFFAWIHLYDTHRPHDLPDGYKDRHFDPYVNAIIYEDAQIARLLRHLENRQLLDSTLIVVAGDHGESLGDHGEESHGIFVYQEALRVPLIFRGPGVPPGRLQGVARLVDVMPTVLDVFGVPVSGVDGVSLVRARGRRDRGPSLEVYSESMYPRRFGWAPLRALRADRYKLIEAPRMELYDLATDPFEQRNVYAANPSVSAAMLRRLRSLDRTELTATAPDPAAALAERLASLGYVNGSPREANAARTASMADPKDRIGVYNKLTSRAAR